MKISSDRKHTYEEHLLKTLIETASAVELRLERAVEQSGLSLAKLKILQHLVQVGGALPLGQLAERLCCVRSNVTQLVDRLEVDGLVRREGDPEDRRSTLAVITDEGRRRCAEASQAYQAAERRIITGLQSDERERLYRLLVRLGE